MTGPDSTTSSLINARLSLVFIFPFDSVILRENNIFPDILWWKCFDMFKSPHLR